MKQILVVAPHPDDETLGCGGTLLRHREAGDSIHWLIVTERCAESGASPEAAATRDSEISDIAGRYGFQSVHRLGFPEIKLDSLPFHQVVKAFSDIVRQIGPQIIYVPCPADIHTDHRVTFDAIASCTKWFRYPSIEKILAYETLSETEFNVNPGNHFQPNFFVDISRYLEEKTAIMQIYQSEMAEFPFPRSIQALCALAALRGASSGCKAAEAFMLLKEIVR
jgi:LmbE family N-acetylglucosaminyl deacetylase